MVSSPSLYGGTRRFETSFSSGGDERYSVSFADDVNAQNFLYDAWVYFTSSASKLGNLELDVNQVMADGKTFLWASSATVTQATGITPSTPGRPAT